MKGHSLMKERKKKNRGGGTLKVVLNGKKASKRQQHKNIFCTVKAKINNMSFAA